MAVAADLVFQPRRHRRRPACRRSRCRSRSRSARSGWRSSSSASSRPRSAPRSRPPCRPATRVAVLRLAVGQVRRGPAQAARFHLVVLRRRSSSALLVGLTGVDPIKVTEYSIVLSAAALPLTYFPILVIANDPDYMGDKVNGRFLNTIASCLHGVAHDRGDRDDSPDDRRPRRARERREDPR